MANLRRVLLSTAPRLLSSNRTSAAVSVALQRPVLGSFSRSCSSNESNQSVEINLSDEESKRRLFNRLLYRSKQRGFLELDLVLGKWIEDNIDQNVDLKTSLDSTDISYQLFEDLGKDASGTDEVKTGKPVGLQNSRGYVSQSAVALLCRVMPPPCLKNTYAKDALNFDSDPFSNQRSTCAGFNPAGIGRDGLSRYRTDFHEIEKIGNGNFNQVFTVQA